MARRPNVLCAGACDSLIWTGSSSLPPGQAMCRSCRAARPKTKPTCCVACGVTFDAVRLGGGWSRATCSDECAADRLRAASYAPRSARPCVDCSAPTCQRGIPLCLACVRTRRRARWRRKNVIRRGAAAVGATLSIGQLGGRDGWRCHLCRRRVDSRLRSPHPRSASFDHLIPVSHGGTDAPENLRLAHRGCNSARGNRGNVQLLLVG